MTARIVHRQDERGVIVDSKVVLEGEELPEGFSESTSYTKVADSRLPQGQPVLIEDSKVKAGAVRAGGTIDEIIEQEFTAEVAGETADSDEGAGPVDGGETSDSSKTVDETIEQESTPKAAGETADGDKEDGTMDESDSDSGKSASRRKASRSS